MACRAAGCLVVARAGFLVVGRDLLANRLASVRSGGARLAAAAGNNDHALTLRRGGRGTMTPARPTRGSAFGCDPPSTASA